MLKLPGIAGIRRRLRIPKEQAGAQLELDFLTAAAAENLKPEILEAPDCRIRVGGQRVWVEIRYRSSAVTLRTIRQEAMQLPPGETGLIVFGGPGAAPVSVLQAGLREIPFVGAIVVWGDPLLVVGRGATLRGMALGKALRAALDAE